MLLVTRGAPAAPKHVPIPLGRGAIAKARTLDAFEVKLIAAEARAEWAALQAGEDTQRVWASLTGERLAAFTGDPVKSFAMLGWMQTVLLAAAAIVELEGVEEVLEGGARVPLAPGFETFELLFIDADIERAFKERAGEIEHHWSAEKNVSGPGPNGSGPVDTSSAPAAVTPATPAPGAARETSPMANADPAPSAPMNPEPPKDSLPPPSATAAAGG